MLAEVSNILSNEKKGFSQFFELKAQTFTVIRNKDGKYLAVRETKERGWSFAGGKADPPESFEQAAVREAKEEGGMDVILKGVLRTEWKIDGHKQRFAIIFYAEPVDDDQKPKDFADKHSEESKWLTTQEILALKDQKPGWRRPELYYWGKYLDEGGIIYPLSILAPEGDSVQMVKKDTIKTIQEL